MSTTIEEPRSPKRDIAQEFIAVSGAKPPDNVIIFGAGNLEMLIEFIQRGFSHVVYQSGHAPHITTQPADILIAPNLKCEAEIRNVLALLTRDLRPRGILVISCTPAAPSITELALRRLLKEGGFSAVKQANYNSDFGIIVCARKEAASIARAA
jgi:hypothetical protein